MCPQSLDLWQKMKLVLKLFHSRFSANFGWSGRLFVWWRSGPCLLESMSATTPGCITLLCGSIPGNLLTAGLGVNLLLSMKGFPVSLPKGLLGADRSSPQRPELTLLFQAPSLEGKPTRPTSLTFLSSSGLCPEKPLNEKWSWLRGDPGRANVARKVEARKTIERPYILKLTEIICN